MRSDRTPWHDTHPRRETTSWSFVAAVGAICGSSQFERTQDHLRRTLSRRGIGLNDLPTILVYASLMRIPSRFTAAFVALVLVLSVAIAATGISNADDGPDFLVLDPRGE